jgi:hypothetical protein
VPIVIAANNADLTGGATTEEIAELCRANGNLQFFETSALNGMNVDDAFECICRIAVERVQAPEAGLTTLGANIEPAATDAPGQPPPAGGGICC